MGVKDILSGIMKTKDPASIFAFEESTTSKSDSNPKFKCKISDTAKLGLTPTATLVDAVLKTTNITSLMGQSNKEAADIIFTQFLTDHLAVPTIGKKDALSSFEMSHKDLKASKHFEIKYNGKYIHFAASKSGKDFRMYCLESSEEDFDECLLNAGENYQQIAELNEATVNNDGTINLSHVSMDAKKLPSGNCEIKTESTGTLIRGTESGKLITSKQLTDTPAPYEVKVSMEDGKPAISQSGARAFNEYLDKTLKTELYSTNMPKALYTTPLKPADKTPELSQWEEETTAFYKPEESTEINPYISKKLSKAPEFSLFKLTPEAVSLLKNGQYSSELFTAIIPNFNPEGTLIQDKFINTLSCIANSYTKSTPEGITDELNSIICMTSDKGHFAISFESDSYDKTIVTATTKENYMSVETKVAPLQNFDNIGSINPPDTTSIMSEYTIKPQEDKQGTVTQYSMEEDIYGLGEPTNGTSPLVLKSNKDVLFTPNGVTLTEGEQSTYTYPDLVAIGKDNGYILGDIEKLQPSLEE